MERQECFHGSYDLEETRLTYLLASALKGKFLKKTGQAKYIARLKDKKRVERRHSDFWVGLYGSMWINAWDFCCDLVQVMMNSSPHKRQNYQRGLTAMSLIEASL